MSAAKRVLELLTFQERADVPVKLTKSIPGETFGKKRSKTTLKPGDYLFIEFDSIKPGASVVTNIATGDLFVVDTPLFKKSTTK